MANESVQTLDARGHSARANTRDFGDVTQAQARIDVGLMRTRICGAQLLIDGEFLVEGLHNVFRLEGRGTLHRGRVRQVVGRRERSPIGQPRSGSHDSGPTAHAARGDTNDSAGHAAQLGTQDLQVLFGCVGGVNEAHSPLSWPVVVAWPDWLVSADGIGVVLGG